MELPKNTKVAAFAALTALAAAGTSFAQKSGLERVGAAAGCMCGQLLNVLPVVSMLMIIGAGIVYAAGQMMGAETRSRATTWASAMLIGAIIGILIVVVAPTVLDILYGGTGTAISGTQGAGKLCDMASCAST